MKKNIFLLFALLLFAGAVHGTAITLVNDDSEPANPEEIRAHLDLDIIYVALGRPACITAVITTEDDETLYYKETGGCDVHEFWLNYIGIPNGKYTLSVLLNGTWWRGDFEFKSHWPEGKYVYVDSTCYRLNKGYATTVEPDYITGHSITYRRLWDVFERDYPIDVVIPSKIAYKGEVYQVNGIEQKSFKWCHYLQSVYLPNTITFIEKGAFMECENLTEINIPESVTSIGTGAFDGCVNLPYIEIPEGITVIGDHTFNNCKRLSDVTLPSSLTTIERIAFKDCTCLPYIIIPENVTTIGEYAFYGCTSLVSVTLPEDITQIDDFAFRGIPDAAHIYCKSETPCRIAANTFNFNCTLYVPFGCKEVYEKAYIWSNFIHIEEMAEENGSDPVGDATGVAPAVLTDDAASDGQFYDLQGRPADGTRKGIYIRNGKKVLVR